MITRAVFFLLVCFQSQVYAGGLQCAELFHAANAQLVQQASEEAEILVKLESLVKSSIDIQLNNFENPAQLQQAKEAFEKHC